MQHRCIRCNKLLFIGTGMGEIKCPRCKTLNIINTQNAVEHPLSTKGKNGCQKIQTHRR